MKNPRMSTWNAIGLLAMMSMVANAPSAVATDGCTALARPAAHRGLSSALRCSARALRDGTATTPCGAQALAVAGDAMARGGAECMTDVPAVDRCLDAVLAEVHEGGRCSTAKLRAARKHVRRLAQRKGAAARSPKMLCRAFARAGECAGECNAVVAALSECIPGRGAGNGGTPPPLDPDHQLVAFGVYEADAISTTSLVGVDDVTETARVVIKPGRRKLSVVLSGYEAIIWRFEGATERVGRVTLVGSRTQAVTGVASALVVDQTGEGSTISSWYEVDSPESIAARSALEQRLGRTIDVFGGAYSVGTLTLPAATVTESETPPAPPGFDAWMYALATFYSPGGVVDVSPTAIVPARAGESYDVLPQAFGLAQLVGSGALEDRDGYLYIARPIPRFPAGLYGAHSVSFVLGRGVPMPAGDPGHSCIVSEETGEPIGDMMCWGTSPPTASCELPDANPDDLVVLFGAYEADTVSTTSVAGQDGETGTARVVIEPGTQPLYVVLSAYDSTIWRFEGDVGRVRRVVLVGYYGQGVTGVTADRVVDQTQWVESTYEAKCFAPFYDPQSPEGITARHTVSSALGRNPDVVAGSYSVGALTLPSTAVAPSPAGTVPAGFDPDVFELATWFMPGGLLTIDPATVVPVDRAEAYVVLPAAFGLSQLVGTGALEYRGGDIVDAVFYIARPLPRFPAGLAGAESVTFILKRGVPMPEGDPGHSCVLSEAGRPLANEMICEWRNE